MKKNQNIRLERIGDAGLNKAREMEMLRTEERALEMIVERRTEWFNVRKNYESPLYDYMANSTRGLIRELKAVRARIESLQQPTVADVQIARAV